MRQPTVRTVAIPLFVVLVLAAVGLQRYLSRPRLTSEQQLYLLLVRAQEAAEARNAAGLTRLLSDDYRDADGYDKHHLTGLIVSGLRGGGPFRVVPTVTGLQVRGDAAQMQLRVRYFGAQGDPAGEDFGLSLQWRREGRQWKVTSAQGYTAVAGSLAGE